MASRTVEICCSSTFNFVAATLEYNFGQLHQDTQHNLGMEKYFIAVFLVFPCRNTKTCYTPLHVVPQVLWKCGHKATPYVRKKLETRLDFTAVKYPINQSYSAHYLLCRYLKQVQAKCFYVFEKLAGSTAQPIARSATCRKGRIYFSCSFTSFHLEHRNFSLW